MTFKPAKATLVILSTTAVLVALVGGTLWLAGWR